MESKFTGLDEFRAELEAAGWRVSLNSLAGHQNICNWYAWDVNRADITPDCACNDKPPSLVVYPYDGWIRSHRLDSLEAVITGETQTGEWLSLKAYSIKPDQFAEKYPITRSRLIAAWHAAASLNQEEHS